MKQETIEIIVCPICKNSLILKRAFCSDKNNIIEGLLYCEDCGHLYPVINGIPRMLQNSVYNNVNFFMKYERDIADIIPIKRNEINSCRLNQLQKNTINIFSFEWQMYSSFGWNDPIYNLEYEKRVFYEKTLLSSKEFEDKIVLDAGCGNGRYLYWASQYGARLAIGVDLGFSVDIVQENLKNNNRVQLIQGDIFNLPFKDDYFEIIFSIGVLMHTGNAKKATECLVKCLRSDGKISIHLYHKSNILYEKLDALLRSHTTKLTIDQSLKFTERFYRLARILYVIRIGKIINGLFFRIDNHPHCIFDWYTAPIATHHDYKEVFSWFKDLGLEILSDRNFYKGFIKEKIKPLKLLVVKGKKRQNVNIQK